MTRLSIRNFRQRKTST